MRRGTADYHDAFVGSAGQRQEGPTADATLAIIAQALAQPAAQVRVSISYIDGQLDVADVKHQVEWYKTQGFVKPTVDANAILDMRYIMPLPDK